MQTCSCINGQNVDFFIISNFKDCTTRFPQLNFCLTSVAIHKIFFFFSSSRSKSAIVPMYLSLSHSVELLTGNDYRRRGSYLLFLCAPFLGLPILLHKCSFILSMHLFRGMSFSCSHFILFMFFIFIHGIFPYFY